MSTLNPYHVHWCIIQFEKPITQIMQRPLTAHGFLSQGNLAMRHCPSKERAEEMRAAVVEDMKQQGRKGRAFIITDKQFGDGTTKYKPQPDVSGESVGDQFPIKGELDGWVTQFPATTMQINESIIF